MSEKMGPVALEGEGGRAMFGRGVNDKEYSDKINAEIDAEVYEIMNGNMKRAEKIIIEHRKALDAIARRLIETETIEREEFEKIITANGIIPKKKEDIEHQK
jgi:cell division protease FtsH